MGAPLLKQSPSRDNQGDYESNFSERPDINQTKIVILKQKQILVPSKTAKFNINIGKNICTRMYEYFCVQYRIRTSLLSPPDLAKKGSGSLLRYKFKT